MEGVDLIVAVLELISEHLLPLLMLISPLHEFLLTVFAVLVHFLD